MSYTSQKYTPRGATTLYGTAMKAMGQRKKILLIIDPQNDFHTGSLAVPGATEDAVKIVQLINSGKFDEIHVSLDTHTPNHIGHPGFYEREYKAMGIYDGDQIAKDLPKDYLNKYNTEHKKPEARGGPYMMWPLHCIENTDGHKIFAPIHDALESAKGIGKNVKYHIKGQNELTEMYSIFSATVDPKKCCDMEERYSGKYTRTYDIAVGLNSYEDACERVNLNTQRNEGLINNLLGSSGQNTVYVCGQAKSHCVADSIIDLLKAKKGKVFLVNDASSPVVVPGLPDLDLAAVAAQKRNELIGELQTNNFGEISTQEILDKYSRGGKRTRKLKRKSSRKTKIKRKSKRKRVTRRR